MKIAYVLNTYPQPSHSFIRREIRALEAQGHDVERIAMRGPSVPLVDAQDIEEHSQTVRVLDAGGIALMVQTLRTFLSMPGLFLRAFRMALRLGRASHVGVLRHMIYLMEACDVRRRCASAGIDHVHAHFGTNATAVALLAHELGGPGFSFTVHGPEEFDQPGALSLGTKINRARFAVGISQFGRSQLSRWAGFEDWDKIKVVHCGIEPARFPDPDPVPAGHGRFVSIGRFVEQKGQMVLIEAMAALRQSHPDAHLTLIGDGEMRPDLEAAIAEHGLQDNITLTGWVDEDRIRDELAITQALVMPSFAEGLPMVVMEAMAAGRPVISTWIAGTPELVQDGITGHMVPAGDPEALRSAMAQVADAEAAQLTDMGRSGRARVLLRHDVRTEAAKLATHMETAIQIGQ